MIKVLKGESTVLKLKRLEEKYKDLKVLDLTYDETFDLLLNILKNRSIFQGEAVVFVKNFDSLKKTQREKVLGFLKSVKDSDEFEIFIDSESDIKGFETVDLSLPKPWKREEWLKLIRKIALEDSLNLNDEILEFIFEKVGPDYDRIHREIEKLSTYSRGNAVTLEEIEDLIHDYNNVILDDLMFAISSGNIETLNTLLSSIFKSFNHQLVLYNLAEHFINLFRILCVVGELKEGYQWREIVKFSKEISLNTSKTARFLGFNFKGQKVKNVNHLKLYDLKKLSVILEKIIDIQEEFRSVESSGVVLKNRLIELVNMIYN